MKKTALKVTVKRTGAALAERCLDAAGFRDRLVGLMGRPALPKGEALAIHPCRQVHTFFMRFPIDAIFVDGDNLVVGFEELRPWRVSGLYWRARQTIEVPMGRCRELGLQPGDALEFAPC